MLVREVLKKGEEACEDAGVYSSFARFLMLELLRENNLDMYFMMDERLDFDIYQDYQGKLKRVCDGEPLSYVLGYHWFYGHKIRVNEDVLIPRQETEELVAHILNYVEDYYDKPVIADVACGSGAIGLALSKELNQHVYATDISYEALEVAKQNASDLETDMTFYQGDMLKPLIKENIKLDILVCNPPYIKETEEIEDSVYDFEPHIALFGGDDGLFFYRKILEDAPHVLNKGGLIAFEIGYDIGEAVVSLSEKYFSKAEIMLLKDMNGLDRFVMIHNKNTSRLKREQKEEIIRYLKDGKTVALPTDTVYGLGVRSDDEFLYDKLKQVKKRPDDKPFPLMVSSVDQIHKLVDLSERDLKLIKKFMPGSITFIFNKKEGVFPFLKDQKTLGIRIASDAWLREIIDDVGVPLWLPSANLSGNSTGTTSEEVLSQLDGRIDGVVMGESGRKESSSVFDLSNPNEIIELRKGPISLNTLKDYLEND